MKTNNRITGPRHLDARTPEGRAYRKKVGKKAFAMARRTEGPAKGKKAHSPRRTDDASGEAMAHLARPGFVGGRVEIFPRGKLPKTRGSARPIVKPKALPEPTNPPHVDPVAMELFLIRTAAASADDTITTDEAISIIYSATMRVIRHRHLDMTGWDK